MKPGTRLLAAAFLAAFLLAPAGCGGKDESPAPAETEQAEPAKRGDHALGGYVQAVDKATDLQQNMDRRQQEMDERARQVEP